MKKTVQKVQNNILRLENVNVTSECAENFPSRLLTLSIIRVFELWKIEKDKIKTPFVTTWPFTLLTEQYKFFLNRRNIFSPRI